MALSWYCGGLPATKPLVHWLHPAFVCSWEHPNVLASGTQQWLAKCPHLEVMSSKPGNSPWLGTGHLPSGHVRWHRRVYIHYYPYKTIWRFPKIRVPQKIDGWYGKILAINGWWLGAAPILGKFPYIFAPVARWWIPLNQPMICSVSLQKSHG